MRWERLFDDLEGQLAEGRTEELRAEVAERTRREIAQVALADRVADSVGRLMTLRVLGAGPIRAVVAAAGPGWLLLTEPADTEIVVAQSAIVQMGGLGSRVGVAGSVQRRLDLGYVLRGIARDRAEVAVTLIDEAVVTGVIERVGADHVDVGPWPPAASSTGWTVPFAGLAAVRRRLPR